MIKHFKKMTHLVKPQSKNSKIHLMKNKFQNNLLKIIKIFKKILLKIRQMKFHQKNPFSNKSKC